MFRVSVTCSRENCLATRLCTEGWAPALIPTPVNSGAAAQSPLVDHVPSSGSSTPQKIFILSHAHFITFVFPKLKSFVTRS